MTYRERREARAERLRGWAEKREQKATAHATAAHDLVKDVPFGQPILIGHHSEAGTRRRQAKVARNMDASIENANKAKEMQQKADNIEAAAAKAIYSDDPDAIERLQEKIEKAEALRAEIKAFNISARKGHPDESLLSVQMQKNLHELRGIRGMMGTSGQLPPYLAANLSGNINRNKKRLASLQRKAAVVIPQSEVATSAGAGDVLGESAMTREELEANALKSVCACWFYELRNDIEFSDGALLQAVVADGMTCHYEVQKHDPVDEDEYQEELRACPSFTESAGKVEAE